MINHRNIRILTVALAAIAALALTLLACGGAAQPTEPPITAPTATVAPTVAATAQPEPTDAPQPIPTTAPAATALPSPTAAPTLAPQPTNTPIPPEPTEVPYPAVPGIVDPSNDGWPRQVETPEGLITLEGPPQRILTYSLGHDEIVLALLPPERIAAIGKFATNVDYSNVVEQATGLPFFEKGAENVLAAEPDLFIVSAYTQQDIVDLVKEVGVPVVRPALENSAEGNIPNILLMGYMFGTEERALELVAEIESRLQFVRNRVPPPADPNRPAVIGITLYSDTIYIPGTGTTEGGIIEAAGGTNAAARDGVEGIKKVSMESVAAMNPDVILVTQPAESGGNDFRDQLLSEPALAAVPAVVNDMVHVVDSRKFTTLSHWNVRGIEIAARLLYPDRFADVTFADFEPYTGE